jgi:hypothetical protein
VAHELGNPLNSLTIHLQLLERRLKKMGAKGASLQEHLDVATGEIKRLDFYHRAVSGGDPADEAATAEGAVARTAG